MSIRAWSAVIAAVMLTACASAAGGPKAHSSVHVEPQVDVTQSGSAENASNTPAADNTTTSLPRLRSAPALSAAPEQRISVLNLPTGTPIATAVTELGAKLGLSVTVDPEVRGTTSASLRNVTLDEALQQIVSRSGYAYQLQGTVLRVVPIHLESRTFHLDYVAISRVGTMSTIVQRRLTNTMATPLQGAMYNGGNSANAGIGAYGQAGLGDQLTAQSVADVWQEIRVALAGILQAGQPQVRGPAGAGESATQNVSAPSLGANGTMAGASSVGFPDGSSLVISPMAGLINVTAMPDKLEAVEDFINEFQASVLRQVLIEAKIVEVTLTKSFQFGIDWSVVSNSASGKYGVVLRSDPNVQQTGNAGNVAFTFRGGNTQVSAILTALESQGDVSVLSNEKTTALNNQRAIFDVTTDEVFFNVTRSPLLGTNGGVVTTQTSIIPQQISVGVVLDVLPQISAENVLTMNIRPAVTSIARVDSITVSDGSTASAPVIARREGDTIARLRAGETMVIGGLVQTRKDHQRSGIPVLRDLPLVGGLFTHIDDTETRSELVVFLTPTIISGQPATSGGR